MADLRAVNLKAVVVEASRGVEGVVRDLQRSEGEMNIEIALGGVTLKFIEWLAQFFQFTVDRLAGGLIKPEESVDERIAKIDAARDYLIEGLKAVEELRSSADVSKRESELALRRLEQLIADKATMEEELTALRTVMNADVSAFRKVAGVPSQKDINRERLLGFVSGVVASLAAAGLIGVGVWVVGLIWT